MGPYKAVLFDLDDTLMIRTPDPTSAFISFARSIDIAIDPAIEKEIKLWVHGYWGDNERVKADINRLGLEPFRLYYSKLLLQAARVCDDLTSRARSVHDWFYNAYKPLIEPAPGSIEALHVLKQRGMQLGLVSNRPAPVHDIVGDLGLGGLFDIILSAGEVGYWKPHPAIFAEALSRLGLSRACDSLYVGDNCFADGFGAERAGLVPILYDPQDLYENGPYRRIKSMKELLDALIE